MPKKKVQPTAPANEDPKGNVVKLDIKPPHRAASERRAHGKSLRDRVPARRMPDGKPRATAAIPSIC
jgi:hypothetical protein